MEKYRILLFGMLLFLPTLLFADICADFLAEGKQNYNSGNYQKAKECFVYVKNECGAYYGDVTNWIDRCDVALNPTLSVSTSKISCSASGTTQYVAVNSNTNWEVQYPSGNMYSVVRNGNSLTVTIYSTTSTESRSDYFNVRTVDGKIVKKITLSQSGKSVSNSLEVSKSLISCSSSATTEYITVTSNTSWQVEYPTGTIYSVTRSGNTLTVKITANASTNSREDFFNVKTTDGRIVKKITIKQSGKTSSSSSYLTPKGKIHKVWVEHNVMYGGEKCMKIHVKFEVDNMKGKAGDCVAWFYYGNGNKLYDTNGRHKSVGGQVSVGESFTATYDGSIWNDFVLYIPNSELHIVKNGSYKFDVGIFDHNGKQLATSDYVTFSYGN